MAFLRKKIFHLSRVCLPKIFSLDLTIKKKASEELKFRHSGTQTERQQDLASVLQNSQGQQGQGDSETLSEPF